MSRGVFAFTHGFGLKRIDYRKQFEGVDVNIDIDGIGVIDNRGAFLLVFISGDGAVHGEFEEVLSCALAKVRIDARDDAAEGVVGVIRDRFARADDNGDVMRIDQSRYCIDKSVDYTVGGIVLETDDIGNGLNGRTELFDSHTDEAGNGCVDVFDFGQYGSNQIKNAADIEREVIHIVVVEKCVFRPNHCADHFEQALDGLTFQ